MFELHFAGALAAGIALEYPQGTDSSTGNRNTRRTLEQGYYSLKDNFAMRIRFPQGIESERKTIQSTYIEKFRPHSTVDPGEISWEQSPNTKVLDFNIQRVRARRTGSLCSKKGKGKMVFVNLTRP